MQRLRGKERRRPGEEPRRDHGGADHHRPIDDSEAHCRRSAHVVHRHPAVCPGHSEDEHEGRGKSSEPPPLSHEH